MQEITVREALELPGAILIDVRSEGEFGEATIPDAVNIPLLRNAEREKVGTTYKNMGAEDARNLGLVLVTPRLPEMAKIYRDLSRQGPLVVFCWRGGLRSKSICSFLDTMGIQVYRLVGGYKAYRRYVNEYLNRPLKHKAVVIHGLTGVGKTEILYALKSMSLPAVDLEGLANNRGSVFGQIGMEPQPSQKMFEGLLVKELKFWESTGYIIVECESRRIGKIILPGSLINAMRTGIHILAYSPVDRRIQRIKRIYAENLPENKAKLKKAITALGQRLGKKRVEEFCQMLDSGRLDEIVEYLLVNYYDPLYKYPSEPSPDYHLCVDTSDIQRAAEEIKGYLISRIQKH